MESNRNVTIVKDSGGKDIVLINDIKFKGKRSINWDDVKKYLKSYIDDSFQIQSTGDWIYIGNDLPNEYNGSEYTLGLKGTNAKAKANATQGIPELITTAQGKHFRENKEDKKLYLYDILDIKKKRATRLSTWLYTTKNPFLSHYIKARIGMCQ
ncbi:hypothetical protein [Pseudobutyrivibrio sp. MD2005]|uniref:hypothetical protein n=1 Tax=Pseudobutyrivibrio sp. MD2005 TaxID=1410616 RepID=UPI0018CC08B5|nr:hypothetical protein [Pseudobutyrivibrio sp. MD2005]